MIINTRRRFNLPLRPALSRSVALSGLLAAMCMMPAFADEAADVTKLLRGGKHSEALSRADAYLSKDPRDAQMRFLKGVILAEQNRPAEAIAIFTKLTEDFPALPEPYNNLAVLHAANGQYEKARAALDAAIRTNPTYATAYENLGDVHAKLASQAYDKALQIESGNPSGKSRLAMVRTLHAGPNGISALADSRPASAPVVAPAVPASSPKPVAPAVAEKPPEPPAPAPKVAAVTSSPAPVPAVKAPVPAPVPPVAKVDVKEEAKPKADAKPVPVRNIDRDEVLEVVNGWAEAWSSRDVKSYLGFYSNDFETPNGQPRKAWEEERRARIAGKGRIHVKIESPEVSVNGNTATAKFRQLYASDRLTANTRKTLLLAKHGGKWRIRQEQASK